MLVQGREGGEGQLDAIQRAWLSLDGLSVGDAFGQRFFVPAEEALRRIARRELPEAPWPYTDDTEMALSIVEILQERGTIHQDDLAGRFARRMQFSRGYGQGAYALLEGIKQGLDWRVLARTSFRGMGSFGNGAAMRAAPLGAYFADAKLDVVVDEARRSAEITHAHPEGIAGGVAVAAAAALAWQARDSSEPLGPRWIEAVRDAVPAGYTRDAITEALALPGEATIAAAARALGNGAAITAPDTVPLCLWLAARAGDFVEALWDTVSALGDRDTTCAIVGGILALKTGRAAIPEEWLRSREKLPISPPRG
jgi:ADP-ribosylglycohydrolase